MGRGRATRATANLRSLPRPLGFADDTAGAPPAPLGSRWNTALRPRFSSSANASLSVALAKATGDPAVVPLSLHARYKGEACGGEDSVLILTLVCAPAERGTPVALRRSQRPLPLPRRGARGGGVPADLAVRSGRRRLGDGG